MATESSAVVRFIEAAQQANQPIQESPDVLPDFTDDVKMAPPVRRSVRALRLALLLVCIFLIVGGAVFAGISIGRRKTGGAAEPPQTAAAPKEPAAPAANTAN